MKIKAILFDIGGVIIDTKHKNFKKYLAECFGVPFPEFKKTYSPIFYKYKTGKLTSEKFWGQIADELKIDITQKKVLEIYIKNKKRMPGMQKIVRQLKGKYILALANNQGKDFDEIRDRKYEIFQHFDKFYSSWRIGFAKPEKEFFEYILKDTEIPPEELLFIDDKWINILAAKSFGINTIHFKNTAQFKKELKKHDIKI